MLGKLIAGRYEIIQHIAGGGMAAVYQGKDTVLDRLVAIKIMNSQLGQDVEFIKRFILEAQATGRLSHANIVNVYDAGEENGTYYMVMEYVEGITLKDYIMQKGFLTPEEAIKISTQICDGLTHAHGHGIIHRDIKPHNILCTPDGRYKLTDFGIARFVEAATHLTKTGTVMGSVHYFSPEQATGHPISFPSDLYSLGIVIFEMITGSVPFDDKEHIQVAMMHLHDEVPDPRLVQEDLPEALKSVIFRVLAKSPEKRFQSADELKEALLQTIIIPPQRFTMPSKEMEQAPFPITREERISTKQPKKNKFKGILVGFGLLLLLMLGYIFFWSPENPKADTTDTTNSANVQSPSSQQEVLNSDSQDANATYVVVTGSFQFHNNAQKMVEQLRDQNFEAIIVKKIQNGQKRYWVYVGTFHSKSKAKERLTEVQQSGVDGTNEAYISKLES